MADPITCSVRTVLAPDGTTNIPVPQGGLGLPGGSSVIISDTAEVQVNQGADGSFAVVVNNASPSNNEAQDLFAELAQETAITTLEGLAAAAIGAAAAVPLAAVGLIGGVIASIFTSSNLTREIFIRGTVDNGNNTDGPPISYCLLV